MEKLCKLSISPGVQRYAPISRNTKFSKLNKLFAVALIFDSFQYLIKDIFSRVSHFYASVYFIHTIIKHIHRRLITFINTNLLFFYLLYCFHYLLLFSIIICYSIIIYYFSIIIISIIYCLHYLFIIFRQHNKQKRLL